MTATLVCVRLPFGLPPLTPTRGRASSPITASECRRVPLEPLESPLSKWLSMKFTILHCKRHRSRASFSIERFVVTPMAHVQLRDVPDADTADRSTRCWLLKGHLDPYMNILWALDTRDTMTLVSLAGRQACVAGRRGGVWKTAATSTGLLPRRQQRNVPSSCATQARDKRGRSNLRRSGHMPPSCASRKGPKAGAPARPRASRT